jgi:hypothetical protein
MQILLYHQDRLIRRTNGPIYLNKPLVHTVLGFYQSMEEDLKKKKIE